MRGQAFRRARRDLRPQGGPLSAAGRDLASGISGSRCGDPFRPRAPHQRHLSKLESLTEREQTILGHIAEGRSNQGIATITSLSVKAVESNIARIYTKLDLAGNPDDSRRVLAALAWLRGVPSHQ